MTGSDDIGGTAGVVAFNEQGLAPVVVQDARSRQVLMLAWANEEALTATLTTRQATFYSRSRGELWAKGATSGNRQHVLEVRLDCDSDALLYIVDALGPACHTGLTSCFDTTLLLSDEGDVEGNVEAANAAVELSSAVSRSTNMTQCKQRDNAK